MFRLCIRMWKATKLKHLLVSYFLETEMHDPSTPTPCILGMKIGTMILGWNIYIYDIFHLLIFTSYIWNITVKTNRNLNSLKEGLQHSCASWFSASGVRLTMWSAGFLFPPPRHAARDHEFSKTNSFVSLIIGFRQSNSNLIIAAPQTQQKNSGSSEASHSLRCNVFQACPRPGRSEETLKNDNRAAQLLKQWTLKN